MNTILTIIRKEFIQTFRDRKMLPILFIAPVLQLVLLGYAANLDVENLRLAIYDQDRSIESRALVADFLSTDYFIATEPITGTTEIEPALIGGTADLVLIIPRRFGADLVAGRPRTVQVIIDGGNSTKGTAALSYSGAVVRRFAAARMEQTRRGAAPSGAAPSVAAPRVTLEPRVWFNPDMETRNFMVPGVLALLLMVITMMLSSLAIVKEKELGTLEQINVTPIRPRQLILGKLIPFVVIGFVDVVLVVLVARFIFAVPFRGSYLLLLLMSLVFLGTTLGLGLFVSSISHTQQQAMMTSVFFLMMPMIFLSGFAFPIESMPRPIQYLTYLLPLRYYFVIVRGIFLKGSGIAVLWDEGLILLAFGIVAVAIGSLGFRKRAS